MPRSEYDSIPAALDPQLKDREVKEPEEDKISFSTLCRIEKDARTLSLVNSFSTTYWERLHGNSYKSPSTIPL